RAPQGAGRLLAGWPRARTTRTLCRVATRAVARAGGQPAYGLAAARRSRSRATRAAGGDRAPARARVSPQRPSGRRSLSRQLRPGAQAGDLGAHVRTREEATTCQLPSALSRLSRVRRGGGHAAPRALVRRI